MAREAEYFVTAEDLDEISRCSPEYRPDGSLDADVTLERFLHWLTTWVKIEDKDTGEEFPFEPWDCQVQIARALLAGKSIIVLKARQLGITWIVAAWVLYCMTFIRFFNAIVVNQDKIYAQDFASDKVKFMYDRLPRFLRLPIRAESKQKLSLGSDGADSMKTELVAVASNRKAGRSKSAKGIVFDEAAFQDWFREAVQGAEPTLKNTNGQLVIVSTSDGPKGEFFRRCRSAMEGRSGLEFFFFPWNAHPDRDTEWYQREKEEHVDDPLYMQREFPATPKEAFEAAGGRVYPYFRESPAPDGHLLRIPIKSLPHGAKLYRTVDPGEKSTPFVCLWAAVIPEKRPRMTVDPACPRLIADLLGWSYKPDADDLFLEEHKDGCDAVRYLVVTFNLVDVHLHFYRELYIDNAAGVGETLDSMAATVRSLSGWELVDLGRNQWRKTADVEEYVGTVFDKRVPLMENALSKVGIRSMPADKPLDAMGEKGEIKGGVSMVRKLVCGGIRGTNEDEMTSTELAEAMRARPNAMEEMGIRVSETRSEKIERFRRRLQERMEKKARPRYGSFTR